MCVELCLWSEKAGLEAQQAKPPTGETKKISLLSKMKDIYLLIIESLSNKLDVRHIVLLGFSDHRRQWKAENFGGWGGKGVLMMVSMVAE